MVYRFNWFSFGFAQNTIISTKLCAISRPSPVSSSTHLDDPGVAIATGYVAIPPRTLTDPDSREFSDSFLFKPTDTDRNLNSTCPLLRNRTLSDMGALDKRLYTSHHTPTS